MESLRDQKLNSKSHLARVRSKGTKPERMIAAILAKLGYRFFQNVSHLPGSPDFVMRDSKKLIFVHGCFWHRHGCRKSSTPKTNTDFWIRKFATNVKRDRRVIKLLKRRGWSVLVLWECKLSDGRSLFQVLRRFLNKSAPLQQERKLRTPAKAPTRRMRHNDVEASGVGKRF